MRWIRVGGSDRHLPLKLCPTCNLRYPNESTSCFVDRATLVEMPDPRLGATVHGHRIEAVLGRDELATTYLARSERDARPCAIEILHPDVAADPPVHARFRRDAAAAQRLVHPNILATHGEGVAPDGSPFRVMELIDGELLSEAMVESPLPLARSLVTAVSIARALAYGHAHEVAHGDLRPRKVLLVAGGGVKLLHFGVARDVWAARKGGVAELAGTAHYAVPERPHSIDAGPRADLYALGVVLFEMVAQMLPFDAPDPMTVLVKHVTEAPPRLSRVMPGVPEPLDELVAALLAKDPSDRPGADRVQQELGALCERLGFA